MHDTITSWKSHLMTHLLFLMPYISFLSDQTFLHGFWEFMRLTKSLSTFFYSSIISMYWQSNIKKLKVLLSHLMNLEEQEISSKKGYFDLNHLYWLKACLMHLEGQSYLFNWLLPTFFSWAGYILVAY